MVLAPDGAGRLGQVVGLGWSEVTVVGEDQSTRKSHYDSTGDEQKTD